MNFQRPRHCALHSNVCCCQNWVSIQWVAGAQKAILPLLSFLMSILPPTPTLPDLPLCGCSRMDLVDGAHGRCFGSCQLATGWPSLCTCGSLLEASNAVLLTLSLRQSSFYRSCQALYRCYAEYLALFVCRHLIVRNGGSANKSSGFLSQDIWST